jgi:hypothetical protein
VERNADRDGPVRVLSGDRDEAIRDLALDHHDGARDRGDVLEHRRHERHRDVVREVRDEHPRAAVEERPPLEPRRIGLNDPHVRPASGRLLERRHELAVELDRDDRTGGGGQRQRQRAEAGADLDDPILVSDRGIGDDRVGEVRVSEEVLRECLRRSDAVTLGEGPEGRCTEPPITR